MMKRKISDGKGAQSSENKKSKKQSSYFGDPKLIPRVRQYLKAHNKKNVNASQIADDLQKQFGEYGRKKKNAFLKMVKKAYEIIKDEDDEEAADSTSKLEERHLRRKQAAALSGSESDDVQSIDGDSDSSFSEDNDSYVQYQDLNAMNNMMSSMYRTTPNASCTSSPKASTNAAIADLTKSHSGGKNATDNCITIDSDSDSQEVTESSALGRNYAGYESFCVDRMGNDMYMKPQPRPPPVVLPMVDNMTFLPQSLMMNSSMLAKPPGHMRQAALPLVSPGRQVGMPLVTPEQAANKRKIDNVSNISVISDITENSVVEKSVNNNDSSKRKTPKKKKDRKQDDSKKGPDVQSSTVTFADIGGNEETLMDICKLLVHMKHPEVYKQLGVTPPRGFLLHGPPGCGKTLLANAIAGELSLPLIKIAATEVVSGVSGESEEKVRELFEKATAAAPCVLFIDEIDAITPKRETASKDMERRIVAQLLSCMDDLNSQVDAPVLVIGATNRPDSLDPALRRAGRFDREISLGIPDEAARGRILKVLCRGLKLEEMFDYDYMAKNTPGYVGADLMALTREAAMTAVNRVFHELQNPPIKSMIPVIETDNSKQPSSDKTTSDKSTSDLTIIDKSTSEETSNEKIPSDKISQDTTVVDSAPSENKVSSQEENKSTSETVTVNGTDESSECKNCDSAENSEPVVHLNGETKDSPNVSKSDIIEIDSTSECRKNSGSNEDVDKNIQTNNSICSMDVSEEIPFTSGASQEVSTPNPEIEGVKSVLDWLKDYPPLNEEQLQKLRIMLQDFKEALKFVQPSAKREGFATIPDVTWDDIGALHSVREELQLAIMAPIRHAQEFKDLGLTQAQGILLAGPPGCGKTLLAKAIANESGINFISVKGPELLNMYVGESERAVRQVFQRGRNSAPCVIFFDELDALCPKRSLSGESGSSVRVVNQLLTEMDGLEERRQVFIMAATNRPDIIDPAILRPGRLDKLLYVGLPSPADRLDILQTITKKGTKPKLASDVSLEDVSNDDRCNGFTGADLAALVREASVCALKSIIKSPTADKSSPQVCKQHFEEAFTKVKPSVSQQERKKYENMREGTLT